MKNRVPWEKNCSIPEKRTLKLVDKKMPNMDFAKKNWGRAVLNQLNGQLKGRKIWTNVVN